MIVPLFAAGLGLLVHWGGHEVRRFEDRAAESVLSRVSGEGAEAKVQTSFASLVGGPLGELDHVRIEASGFECPDLPFFTEPTRSKRGRINELTLVLTDFRIGGLAVERLEATIPDCRFDYSAAIRNRGFHLSRSGEGTAVVTIRQEALAEYARRKFSILDALGVKVDRDKVFLEGVVRTPFGRSEFWLISGLEPRSGAQLGLIGPRFNLDGRRTDIRAVPFLAALIDPVVDLDKDLGLHGALTLRDLRLRDGVIVAAGAFRFPALDR